MKSRPSNRKMQRVSGPKRAGVYVRVSSEKQAERVSPQIQEQDAIEYCKAHGYVIVEIFRDIEKYRSGGRVVEPSGTRSDRPAFCRMLADIDAAKLDVIIAWREDRLYRGAGRAMAEINDRVKEKAVEVELVKEHYDPTTAPVKAWAGGIELQAKQERFYMGVRGRFAKGMGWNGVIPYGYVLKDGFYVEQPQEAKWLKQVWDWYANGIQTLEIRQRLIDAGVPQKRRAYEGRTPVAWATDFSAHAPEGLLSHGQITDQVRWRDLRDTRTDLDCARIGQARRRATG